jgi:hypothetical protein
LERAVGLILPLPPLVADDIALLVQFFLRVGTEQMTHPI